MTDDNFAQQQSLYVLYRIYSHDGALLYIGASTSPGARFQAHGWRTPWWGEAAEITLQHCGTHEALRAAETEAIKAEKPIHNRLHLQGRPFKRPRAKGEGTICQRANGYWYAAISVPGKKHQKTFYGKTREIVEAKLADFKASLAV